MFDDDLPQLLQQHLRYLIIPDNAMCGQAAAHARNERVGVEIALTNGRLTRIITIAIRGVKCLGGYRLEVRTRDFQSLSRGSIPRIPIPLTRTEHSASCIPVWNPKELLATTGSSNTRSARAPVTCRGGEMADTYA